MWLGGMHLPVSLEKYHLIAASCDVPYLSPEGGVLPNVHCLMQDSQPYFRAYDNGRTVLVGNNHPDMLEYIDIHRGDDGDWDDSVSMEQEIHCATLAAFRFAPFQDARISSSW